MSEDLPQMFGETVIEKDKKAGIKSLLESFGMVDESYKGISLENPDYPDEMIEDDISYPDIALPEELVPESTKAEETPEVKEPEVKKEVVVEKDKSKYEFNDVDIQNAILHHVKPKAKWKKEYKIYTGFSVWMCPVNDRASKDFNELALNLLSYGDKRIRVDVVDSYYDTERQVTIPGGRSETEYYLNPDAPRKSKRAEMALSIASIGENSFEGLSLDKRLTILEEYSPEILNIIYDKAYLHFTSLITEAKERIADFY